MSSIQVIIDRLSGNVSAALSAIEAKGVTIPSGANSDDLATLIAQIEGGGDEPSGPTETLLGQTPYTLTEDANIRLKSTSETTYSTGSGVVADFDDRENQTLTSVTLTDQGSYWELADDGAAGWYASEMTFTISGLTVGNTYTARIGAAGDGTTSMSGYWSIYDQSSSTMGDTPLVSQALETTDGALQFTPTESTILVRVMPSISYYWDQGVKTSRFSYFRIEGEVSGTFTGSVDLGQLTIGTTITSTPSCDVYAITGSSGESSATLITKTITENGTYNAYSDNADGYSSVTVNVPTPAAVEKNVQTQQSTSRRNNTALGSVTSLTCEVAGTYDVDWTCTRSSTSGTWGSQLYINGTAYGTENTTFSNNVQNNHLTGVTIPANATVAVYGRSRSGYYIYVPQLTIEQTA